MTGDAAETPDVMEEAAALGDGGDWEGALQQLQGQLSRDPDDPGLLCAAGLAARNVGEVGLAYDYFQRSIAADPEDPVVLATAGSGLALLDDPEAERVLRLAALAAPEVGPVRLMYGSYLAEEGYRDDAIRELDAARTLLEDQPETRAELGAAYLLIDRPDDALEVLEGAMVGGPTAAGWAETLYVFALLRAERVDDAGHALSELAPRFPEDVRLQLLAATAYAAAGWEDAAESSLAAAEVSAEGADLDLLEDAEDAFRAGPTAAREFLLDTLVPAELGERLRDR